MPVRKLDRTRITGDAGLVITSGTHAADLANEVLTQLFDLRSGLDAAPLRVASPVQQVAIAWGSSDVRVLVLGDGHSGVGRVTDDWPLEPIRTECLPDSAAASRELSALLAAARQREVEPVWLVGAAPDSPFALLERHGLSDLADRLRALAATSPELAPLDALRAIGFGALADRLIGASAT